MLTWGKVLNACTGRASAVFKARSETETNLDGEEKLSPIAELCQNSSSVTQGGTQRERQRGLGITSPIDIP